MMTGEPFCPFRGLAGKNSWKLAGHGADSNGVARRTIVWEKIGLLTGGTKNWKTGMNLLPW